MNKRQIERGRKRLEKLADLLEEKPDRTLEMSHYGLQAPDDPLCGSYACAIGEAALSPKFPGMKAEWETYGYTEHGYPIRSLLPVYQDQNGLRAAKAYFGISHIIADALFMPDSYKPVSWGTLWGTMIHKHNVEAGRVAKRIRQYLRESA